MKTEIEILRRQIEDLKADNLRLLQSENEAVYRSLFENNHAVMLLIDPDTGAVMDANTAACAYYGWSREELKALSIEDINTLTRDEILTQMQLAQTEKRRNFIFKHRRADGSIRDVEIYSGPLTVKGQTLLHSIAHDITDRVQAQRLLAESERRLSTLMANLPGMAYRCLNDELWTMKFVSEGCLPLTGYSPDHLLENRRAAYADLIHPDDRQMVWEQVQAGIAKRTRFNMTYRIHCADGIEKWVMETGQGVLSDAGELLAIEGFITDITERKRSEDALRQSEEKFRLAFQTSPDSINFNRLSDGLNLDINQGFSNLTGYGRDEAIGKTSLEINIWAEPADRKRLVELLATKGYVENFESKFRRKNGQIGVGLMSARVLTMNEEKVILSITRDITDRKMTEEALRESEAIFNAFMEHCPVYVFFKDENIRPIRLSRNYEQMLGRPIKEVLGKSMDELFPTDLAKGMIADDLAVINGGRAIKVVEDLNGRTFETTKFPIQQYGKPTMLAGFTIDITERKQADQHREKLETQLRQAQKMEAIGTLAGGIAHDFNNILSVILGNAELLKMSDISVSGQDELEQILTASKRAKDLVRHILAFSRQGEQKKLLMSLKPVVKETVEFLRASIPSTIQLQQYLKPDSGAIMADPTQMQQVLMNLCTNAAHAMEKEGGVLKVELDTLVVSEADEMVDPEVEKGEYVRLIISDTGHGIESELLPRIFDPYFTTKGPEKGTGLGLSVVHGIVKSHEGIIKVYSEVGNGTVFHVLFPRADGAVRKEEVVHAQVPFGVERVLVVDDELHIVEMYKRMLGLLGYQVDIRTSPVEALEALRSNPMKYDLILTDMTMPQMNGYHFAKNITEIRSGLPIILCTGFSDQINEEKARSVGIHAFLLKPVLFHDLANALRMVLDEGQQRKPH